MHLLCLIVFKFLMLIPALCFAGTPFPVPPTSISTPGVDASAQQIAIDPNGNVIVVWVEGGVVQSLFNHLNGGWTAPITTISGSGATSPQVTIDPQGNATVIWVENGQVKVSTTPLNGSWSTPVVLSGLGALSPQIAVDSSGDLIAVWELNPSGDPTQGLIQSATHLASGSWPGTPDTLSSAGASFPQIGVGITGDVVVVWQAIDPSTTASAVYSVSKSISGSWSAPQIISTSGVNSAYPKVVVNSSGTATAVWFRFNQTGNVFSNVVLQSSSAPFNGSWSTPVDLSTAGERDPGDLVSQIAIGGDVYIGAAWTISDGIFFNEQFSINKNGAWQPSITPIGLNLMAYDITLDVDDRGDGFFAWMYLDPSTGLTINGFMYSVSSPQSAFGTVWTMSNGGENAYPCGVVSKGGSNVYGALAFLNNNGTNNNIQALTTQFDIAPPPSNLNVTEKKNNYGVLTEIDNVLTWTASPGSNLQGYRVFRDGVFIGNVPADTTTYTDPNRKTGITTVYSVSAYAAQGFQSDLIEFTFTDN